MNLIEKFESMPFQDVGTFNSIFKKTPILGVASSVIVEIAELNSSNRRRIKVGGDSIFLDLTQKYMNVESIKKPVVTKKKQERVIKISRSLSSLYKTLKPAEFMIYSAIRDMGEVDGIEELARKISIHSKTIAVNLHRLVDMGLVKKQTLICSSGIFSKLTIDTSVK